MIMAILEIIKVCVTGLINVLLNPVAFIAVIVIPMIHNAGRKRRY